MTDDTTLQINSEDNEVAVINNADNTDDDGSFGGEIKVASRIIDYLSSGLYHTPAACLKELVNNSYDAKAKVVNIFVKPDADRIIIEDDGEGMSKDDFIRHFDRVSESHKRDGGDLTSGDPPTGGRPKIGKIGIGFIAANELCEVLEIFSTKAGSTELMHVLIDFREMRKPIEERRRGEKNEEIVKADYKGKVLEASLDEHYTQLFLTEVRGAAKDILASNKPQSENVNVRSLYGLNSASIAKILKDNKLNTWKEFDPYSETMLQIGLNVPVQYHPNWIPEKFQNSVKEFEENINKLNFKVFYDGTELKKPIVFNPPNQSMLIDSFDFIGEHVSAKGYFYAQHGTVKPYDLQGLLVRIRQAAVGEYDHSFWGFSPTESSLIQRWLSVEIWADDRLEDAMNIDRRTLRIAHPAYVELQNIIHTHLRSVLKKALKDLYEAGNNERKQERKEITIKNIQTFSKNIVAPLSTKAALNINRTIKKAIENKKSEKSLQKKFSVTELYEIVIEVAKEVLTPNQLEKFLERLTERLGDE